MTKQEQLNDVHGMVVPLLKGRIAQLESTVTWLQFATNIIEGANKADQDTYDAVLCAAVEIASSENLSKEFINNQLTSAFNGDILTT